MLRLVVESNEFDDVCKASIAEGIATAQFRLIQGNHKEIQYSINYIKLIFRSR
jgi:hypothetical protein